MVANPLQVARDNQRIQRLRHQLRLLFDQVAERAKRIPVHVVHLVIQHQHRLRHLRIAFDERLQRLPHHRRRQQRQPRNIHRQIDIRLPAQVQHASRDIHRLVAHAFQVHVDPDHRKNKPQINRHRLFHRQQVQRQLIDLALHPVDRRLGHLHQLAQALIARGIGLRGPLDRLLHQSRHHQQAFLQLIETLLKFDPYHPNLPVM